MDLDRLDRLARSIASAGSRRGVLGFLAAAPVAGGLFGILDDEDALGKNRRHRQRVTQEKKKKQKKKCKPKSQATACAGLCGIIATKQTCNKPVNCGPCDCPAPCAACFVCDAATRICVVDPAQLGDPCGSAGQVCTADGTCACTSAAACVTSGAGDLCCNGSCVAGVCCSDSDCDSGETCCGSGCADLQTDPEHCGTCGHTCSGDTPICWDGACVCGNVCPSGCQFTSVQAAIDAALTGSTIRICAGTYGAVNIDRNLTLTGAGSTTTILDGNLGGTVMRVAPGVAVTVHGLQITNGQAATGAGVFNQGTLSMTECLVSENHGDSTGGGAAGVWNGVSSTLTMTDCTVRDNTTIASAGGMANAGTLTLTNCLIGGNHADVSGGGLANLSGQTATLDGTTVSGNTSIDSPAGVRNDFGATLNLVNGSSITGNTPGNCGGTGVVNGPGCVP